MFRLPLIALVASLSLAVAPLALAEHEPSQPLSNPSASGDPYQADRDRAQRPRDYESDAFLHDRVHDAIEGALGRDASRIRVDVRRGHVYLSGKVRDARTRALAHRVAHDVPGVNGVSVRGLYASRW